MTDMVKPPHTLNSYGVEYDVYKLIALSAHLPTKVIAIQSLEKEMIEEKCWSDTSNHPLSPNDLIIAFNEYRDWQKIEELHPTWSNHIRKVINADYSFPMLYYKGEIIDGMHRLVKAIIDSHDTITIRELHTMPAGALVP